jgi:hypothetical protein
MPCPDDSWNSTPPLPEAITTGIRPAGAGLLASMATARSAALRATSSGGNWSSSSKPIERPGPSKPVWTTPSRTATTWTTKRVRTRSSRVEKPSELAIITCWRTSP